MLAGWERGVLRGLGCRASWASLTKFASAAARFVPHDSPVLVESKPGEPLLGALDGASVIL